MCPNILQFTAAKILETMNWHSSTLDFFFFLNFIFVNAESLIIWRKNGLSLSVTAGHSKICAKIAYSNNVSVASFQVKDMGVGE